MSPALRHMHASPDEDADWILSWGGCAFSKAPLSPQKAVGGLPFSLQTIRMLIVMGCGLVVDAETGRTMCAMRRLVCLMSPSGELAAARILLY